MTKAYFDMKGFALGLTLKQRQSATREKVHSFPFSANVYNASESEIPRETCHKSLTLTFLSEKSGIRIPSPFPPGACHPRGKERGGGGWGLQFQ